MNAKRRTVKLVLSDVAARTILEIGMIQIDDERKRKVIIMVTSKEPEYYIYCFC